MPMRAMVLSQPGTALQLQSVPIPQPGAAQVQVRVLACGVCRTDLHVVDGELTRRDGEEFLPLAASIPIQTYVTVYALEQANQTLDDLRAGCFTGAAVVVP